MYRPGLAYVVVELVTLAITATSLALDLAGVFPRVQWQILALVGLGVLAIMVGYQLYWYQVQLNDDRIRMRVRRDMRMAHRSILSALERWEPWADATLSHEDGKAAEKEIVEIGQSIVDDLHNTRWAGMLVDMKLMTQLRDAEGLGLHMLVAYLKRIRVDLEDLLADLGAVNVPSQSATSLNQGQTEGISN